MGCQITSKLGTITRVGVGLALLLGLAFGFAQQVRTGVWLAEDLKTIPVPDSGYDLYLVGEWHGIEENGEVLAHYLEMLNKETGLRDVAIEEDAVYEPEAQAFVEGTVNSLPEMLCLRAGVLELIRRLNDGRGPKEIIRVHLVDIDSPALSIRRHLLAIQERIAGSDSVTIPAEEDIKDSGLDAVESLRQLTENEGSLSELRTVRHSICAYKQGFAVGTGQVEGSPYLEDREQAIAENIRNILNEDGNSGVLALYGSDHVSKSPRKDGGPERDQRFEPMALRLSKEGFRVFSLLTFPLSGGWQWRGRETEVFWSAADGSLESGETMDQLLSAAPETTFLYIDRSQNRAKLPSQDLTAFEVDAYLLYVKGTPMRDYCRAE